MPPVRSLLAVVIALSAGCVERTTVIGDERSQHACEEAVWIEAPASGCTQVRVESRSPYGCSLRDPAGNWLEEHAGTWVRLHRPADQAATLEIRVLPGGPVCAPDAGTECEPSAELTTVGDAPCACVLGSVERHLLARDAPTVIALVSTDQEVLLEPLGTSFDVSLCAGPRPP